MNSNQAVPSDECAKFSRGHLPHRTIVRQSLDDSVYRVEILGSDGNYIYFRHGDEMFQKWNHSLENIEVAKRHKGPVEYSVENDLLFVEEASSRLIISLSDGPSDCCAPGFC
ncbi:MAG: hypothetical protein Q4E01_07225 [Actinomycetaceae bacterium]|nr:hypothetical protein [Actinomycetaceae bacterium]